MFAASEVVWGALRDAAGLKDRYWYWPGVKKYMTYVFSSYKGEAVLLFFYAIREPEKSNKKFYI